MIRPLERELMEIAQRTGRPCWFLGVALSALAMPGVALAQAAPATAPAPSTSEAPHAAPPAPRYPPPAPGYGYPPPGYGYPPPAPSAAERVAVLEAQIRDLQNRYDEITLALPTVLLVGGILVGALGVGIVLENVCPKDQYGDPQDPSCVENSTSMNRGWGLFAAGALGVAFGGTSLIIRTARRRHIDRQIDARQIEVNALKAFVAPRVGLNPTRNGGGALTLALDF
jgi:hypothetical protein